MMKHEFMKRQRSPGQAGLSLVEVMISIVVLSILTMGILATLLQSRRATEGSIYQVTATTVATGYLEQLKTMNLASLANIDSSGIAQLGTSYPIPTLYPQPDANTEATSDPLYTSIGSPPAITSLTLGTTPTGGTIVDNLKSFDMAKNAGDANINVKDTSNTATVGGTTTNINSVAIYTTWPLVWPGAQNYPATTMGTVTTTTVNPTPTTTTPGLNDLHMNIWVWITDLSGTTTNAQKVYGIRMYYQWQYQDGKKTRYAIDSLYAIRSSVPNF
jgi:prepilin-type N-terminal cleavage/methylation domain-containing protein